MKLFGRVSVVALTVLAASTLAFAGQKGVAQGTVTSVSDRIVSVVGENGEAWTFEVTQGARVYAQGATHKSQMLVANGRETTMRIRPGRSNRHRVLPGAGRHALPHEGARALTGRIGVPGGTARVAGLPGAGDGRGSYGWPPLSVKASNATGKPAPSGAAAMTPI